MIRCIFFASVVFILSCEKEHKVDVPKEELSHVTDTDSVATGPAYFDLPSDSAPRFVDVCYIDLAEIGRISRFRSGVGHDNSDDFEFCRSMKHYFYPLNNNVDSIGIYSPVNGIIVRMFEEWAGYQIHIQSGEYPAFHFVIYHVDLFPGIQEGSNLTAGQQLGYHIGTMTSSDIAVKVFGSVNGPKSDTICESGMRLFSIFDVVSDSIFSKFQQRGVSTRESMIITRQERDASPLNCNGEYFSDPGTISNWIDLQ